MDNASKPALSTEPMLCPCDECSTSHCAATTACQATCCNDHALTVEEVADADRAARREIERAWDRGLALAREDMERGLSACSTREEAIAYVRGPEPAVRFDFEWMKRAAGSVK